MHINNSNPASMAANFVGRLLIGGLFIMAGWSKIGGYEGTQGFMEAAGVPGGLLPLVILL
ncbi:MAG: DoxX family protein, partial [Gammaproteobacteria bacterium]